MTSEAMIENIYMHFQGTSLQEGRAKAIFDELMQVNDTTRDYYDRSADFNAQPADFFSALIELKRQE